MNTTHKLILSNTTGIQDTESTLAKLNTPATVLLTSIQLHIAQKALHRAQFTNSLNYELLVHLGHEEEALLQARLSKSIKGLDTIYLTLKEKGISRPDLLDEMLFLAMRDNDVLHRSRWLGRRLTETQETGWLSERLIEAERYVEALEIINMIRIDRSNQVKILIIAARALNKLGRLDKALINYEKAERVIRDYHCQEETIPPFTKLSLALIQAGETGWGNRLLTEIFESIQIIDASTILEDRLISDMRFVAKDFREVGRTFDANQMLIRAEDAISKLEKGPKQIDMVGDLLYWYLDFNQREKAVALVTEVERVALTLTREAWEQAYIPTPDFISHLLAKLGFIERALEFAGYLKTNHDTGVGFLRVIEALIEAGSFDQAQALFPKLTDPKNRNSARRTLAYELAKAGRHTEAEVVLAQLELTKERPRSNRAPDAHRFVLVNVALASTGQRNAVRAVFPRTLDTIEQTWVGSSTQGWLFSEFATGLAKHGFPDLSMQIVRKHYFTEQDSPSRSEFDADQVARVLAEHEHYDEALEIIRGIRFWTGHTHHRTSRIKARLLFDTAVILSNHGNNLRADEIFEEARALLEVSAPNRPSRLNTLARYLLKMKKPDEAQQLLAEVSQLHAEATATTLTLTAVQWTILDNKEQASELFTLAQNKALQIAHARRRSDTLLSLVDYLFWTKRPEEARSVLPHLQDSIKAIKGKHGHFPRADRRLKLAQLLVKAGEVDLSKPLLSNIKRAVSKSNRGYRRSKEVRAVILALGRTSRWDEALALASTEQDIWDDWGKAEQFLEFLNILNTAGKQDTARQVLSQAWKNAHNRPTHTSYQNSTAWASGVQAIGQCIARSGMIAEAMQVFDECKYPYGKKQIAFELANNLASKGRFPEALPLLDHVDLDQYIEAICQWAPHLEKIESGLGFATLREVIRIVGWARADWHEIYELIAQDDPGSTP